ncbi:class I SAM-dependent DNA methyltransferase [Vibrio lentus]|uniref:class I SAM-dependent DNA methyltransferase n=1 Tax=Vibrio lentus TaxID=136468 RepID=UPI003D1512F4
MSYYDNHAERFIQDTLHVDMSPIYERFLQHFRGKTLIDIGCGPGRDIKHFCNLGFDVTGVEPSSVLSQFAKNYTQAEIIESTIQALRVPYQFDGIWACASLLHISSDELPMAFDNIAQIVKPDGVIYCSFKHGEFEGVKNGRFFNFRTIDSLKAILPRSLTIVDHWITSDQRKDRSDEWLNVIISAKPATTRPPLRR